MGKEAGVGSRVEGRMPLTRHALNAQRDGNVGEGRVRVQVDDGLPHPVLALHRKHGSDARALGGGLPLGCQERRRRRAFPSTTGATA
jgi:hypothetical protein